MLGNDTASNGKRGTPTQASTVCKAYGQWAYFSLVSLSTVCRSRGL